MRRRLFLGCALILLLFAAPSLNFNPLLAGITSWDLSIIASGDAWGGSLPTDIQSVNVTPVPEPSAILLLAGGLGGIWMFGKKKKS